MDYFSSREFWCVAMDLRGYNDSEKPKGIKSYAMEYLVSDVKDVIEGLGAKSCILVGHDWGGAIGYAFVAKWPSMVKKYIGWISEYIFVSIQKLVGLGLSKITYGFGVI